MKSKNFSDVSSSSLYGRIKDFFQQTYTKVVAGGLLVAALTTGLSYRHETQREYKIPLAFSEISRLEKDAEKRGEPLGPFNTFYPCLNDAVMKVFECYRESKERILLGSHHGAFASELEMRLDPSFKFHHHELPELLTNLPTQAFLALNEISEFTDVRNRMEYVNTKFDDAWNDSHIDRYRTEVRTEVETYIDSEGNTQTRTVTKTEEVYDHTTHTYTYNREEGEEASRSLNILLSAHPVLKFREHIYLASQTGAENEYVIGISQNPKNKKLSSKEYLFIANRWWSDSTLRCNLPHIYSLWQAAHQDSQFWNIAKNHAKNHRYNTYSHFDGGPEEFRIAENALNHGTELHKSINEIVEGVQYVRDKAPHLHNLIKKYVSVVLEKEKGNPNKLSKEILEVSRNMYKKNFKEGLDVNPFRAYMIFFWSLMGLVGGGLIGLGLDRAISKYGN